MRRGQRVDPLRIHQPNHIGEGPPDATLLLLVWPPRRRPLIRGASRSEVAAAFWTITDVEPSHFSLPKPMELLLRPDEQYYRLRRG